MLNKRFLIAFYLILIFSIGLSCIVLGQGGGEVDKFIKDLSSPDDDTRHSAAWALGNLGNQKAVQPLIKALSDKNENVRAISAESLGKLKAEEAVEPLILRLEDPNWAVRVDAASALAKIGDKKAVPPLIKLLQDEDETVRATAVEALGSLKATSAIEPLCKALKDPEERVRQTAAKALGDIGDPQAIKPLGEALLKDKDDIVKIGALESLKKIKSKETYQYIIKALNDNNAIVRSVAVNVLSIIGDKSCITALEKRKAIEEDPEMKKEIDKAIQTIEKSSEN